MIKVIGDQVEEYDNKFQPDGAHKWFADFWREAALYNKWNIATLNYDTCIEKSIKVFEDGYQNTQTEIGRYINHPSEYIKCYKYSPENIRGSELTKIMHLHGSILFGYPIKKIRQFYEYDNNDLYKFESCCEAKKSWDRVPFMPKQALETTITGPIITGLGKTDKLLCYPYIDYNNLFYESLYNNNRILIAGYSFGDTYINNMLDRFAYLRRPKKVVIITQKKDDDFKWSGSLSGIEEFICKTTNNEKPFGVESLLPPPAKSLDDSIRLYIGGMRDAIEKHGSEILDFLTS